MKKSVLSGFVDESGKFQYPDRYSRFYIVGMVFHDKSQDASEPIRKLSHGEPLNYDKSRIFRGPRIFKHDILRSIKHKEI